MRTQEEILARYKSFENRGSVDVFGFRRDVLLSYLDYEIARSCLKEGVTAQQWAEARGELDPMKELREYLVFAWGKVSDHRGLSANRSVEKLTEYAWLLGRDDVIAAVEAVPYPQYGAPKLAKLSEMLGLLIPGDAKLVRMIAGLSCVPNCVEGCGV